MESHPPQVAFGNSLVDYTSKFAEMLDLPFCFAR